MVKMQQITLYPADKEASRNAKRVCILNISRKVYLPIPKTFAGLWKQVELHRVDSPV